MPQNMLEQRLLRMKDAHDIENIIATISYYQTAAEDEMIFQRFSASPDVSVTISNLGTWKGLDGIRRLYSGFITQLRGDRVGEIDLQCTTNPSIEVAQDRTSAKALLLAPGLLIRRNDGKNLSSAWNWIKLEYEFCREEDGWKILHLRIYLVFYAPYGETFIGKHFPKICFDEQFAPDESGAADISYRSDAEQELFPVPPMPY